MKNSLPSRESPKFYSRLDMNERISKLSKAVYNAKLNIPKIQLLERIVLRGEVDSAKSVSPLPGTHKRTLSAELKSAHFNTRAGQHVLNLPKLPFGSHEAYNNEAQFSKQHFYSPEDIPPTRKKEILSANKQLRLLRRQIKGVSYATPVTVHNRKFSYDTRAGMLVCRKNSRVIEAYEKESSKYSKELKMLQTFRNPSEELKWKKKILRNFKNSELGVNDEELLN